MLKCNKSLINSLPQITFGDEKNCTYILEWESPFACNICKKESIQSHKVNLFK